MHYRRSSEPPEVPAAARGLLPETSEQPQILFEGTAWFVTGNVVYHLDRGHRLRPYVLGGAGVVSQSSRRTEAFPNVPERTVTELTFNAGAGMEIVVSRRVALRPEFRTSNFLILSSRGSALYQNRFTMALAYHR
jgi:opacity protein-like surface antigen